MLAIQKVLMPTDFSDCALQALGHALFWARRHHAELTVLHVIDDCAPGDVSERDIRSEIKKLLDAHGALERGAWAVLRSHSARAGILTYAREHAMDLIVMGTHGRTPFGALLLGSVAQDVIRGAPCPVLAVRQSARPAIPGPLARIVVFVDFSPWSGQTIRFARELAARDDATLLLLHVTEEAFGAGARPADALERLYQESPGPEVPVEMHVLRGRPAEGIPAFASRNGASLLVMSSHGAPDRGRRFPRGVTEETLGCAPCPVLALRPAGRTLVFEPKPAIAARALDDVC